MKRSRTWSPSVSSSSSYSSSLSSSLLSSDPPQSLPSPSSPSSLSSTSQSFPTGKGYFDLKRFNIPNDVMVSIIEYLGLLDKKRLSRTNHYFSVFILSNRTCCMVPETISLDSDSMELHHWYAVSQGFRLSSLWIDLDPNDNGGHSTVGSIIDNNIKTLTSLRINSPTRNFLDLTALKELYISHDRPHPLINFGYLINSTKLSQLTIYSASSRINGPSISSSGIVELPSVVSLATDLESEEASLVIAHMPSLNRIYMEIFEDANDNDNDDDAYIGNIKLFSVISNLPQLSRLELTLHDCSRDVISVIPAHALMELYIRNAWDTHAEFIDLFNMISGFKNLTRLAIDDGEESVSIYIESKMIREIFEFMDPRGINLSFNSSSISVTGKIPMLTDAIHTLSRSCDDERATIMYGGLGPYLTTHVQRPIYSLVGSMTDGFGLLNIVNGDSKAASIAKSENHIERIYFCRFRIEWERDDIKDVVRIMKTNGVKLGCLCMKASVPSEWHDIKVKRGRLCQRLMDEFNVECIQ